MKPLVIGTREDVAGFALAGVEGVVCATPHEVERAIANADRDTLVIVVGHRQECLSHTCSTDTLVCALPVRT